MTALFVLAAIWAASLLIVMVPFLSAVKDDRAPEPAPLPRDPAADSDRAVVRLWDPDEEPYVVKFHPLMRADQAAREAAPTSGQTAG